MKSVALCIGKFHIFGIFWDIGAGGILMGHW